MTQRAFGSSAQLYTPDELASYLQISRATIHRYTARGMPTVRLSKKVYRFRIDEVMKWLEEKGARRR